MRRLPSYFRFKFISAILALFASTQLLAVKPDDLIKTYSASGKTKADAQKGKAFYEASVTNSKNLKVSCTDCHTKNPKNKGKTTAGKVIEPMAISVNKARFTDAKKVEKWFKRNCKDVYERECTAGEKADFIAFMKSQ